MTQEVCHLRHGTCGRCAYYRTALEAMTFMPHGQWGIGPASGTRITQPEKLSLAGILILFLLPAVHAARLRPFWFDELSTLFITSTPTLRAMFHAIPTDGNPPLYFLMARPLLRLPIRTELALRLPAILAYLLASLTVYWFVRRNAGRIFALLSMSMFLGCGIQRYAVEARPYSLLLAFTGVVLCCWQVAIRKRERGLALTGISACTAAAICSHNYGVIYALLPLLAGEVVRSYRRQQVDLPLLASAGLGSLALCLTIPPTLRGQQPWLAAIRRCPVFWAHPHLADLRLYEEMLPPFIAALVVLVVFAVILKYATLPMPAYQESAPSAAPEEGATALALALFLPAMLLITHFSSGYFQTRYALGSAMGLALLSGIILSFLSRRWPRIANVAWAGAFYCLIVALLGVWMLGATSLHVAQLDPLLRSADTTEPIVIASALQFSPAWWYSDARLRERLHYLSDLHYAEQNPDFIPEYSLSLERAYTPMQLDDYAPFLSSHPHFLLYCYGEPRLEWTMTRLIREGWHLRLMNSEGERTLYDVTAPTEHQRTP
jgi:hypothetical protein